MMVNASMNILTLGNDFDSFAMVSSGILNNGNLFTNNKLYENNLL